MKKIIFIIFISVIISLLYWACNKEDPVSPTISNELTQEEWNQIIKSDSLIALTADSLLLLQNPQTGWQQMANIYSSYPMVDSVEINSNFLRIKYIRGGISTWYKPPEYFSCEKNLIEKANSNVITKSDVLSNDNKVCILFNNADDPKYWFVNGYLDEFESNLQQKGFNPERASGITANIFYYKNYLKGNKLIFIIGHGANSNGFVEMQTGERGDMEYIKNNYNSDWVAGRITSMKVPFGLVPPPFTSTKDYVGITHNFYDYYYQQNDFLNDMIYISDCQTFKGTITNTLSGILLSKGFSTVVGWNEVNCHGWRSGIKLVDSMITGKTLGEAYLCLPYNDIHENDCFGYFADMVYFPIPGAENYSLFINIYAPPNPPSNPNPDTNAINQPTSLTLSWTCTDPDPGDILQYDVYIQDVNPPTYIISQNQNNNNYNISNLQNNKTYYWKIVAKDNHGLSTSGPVWSFSTGAGTGGGNVILPLSVGNWWKFNDDYGFFQDTSRLTISGTTNVNGQQCFNWQWVGDVTKWYLKNQTNSGCWCYGAYYNGGNLSGNPDIMLKYPANINDSWVSNWILLTQTTTVYCQATNTSFANYSGCYKYYHTATADADNIPVSLFITGVSDKLKDYVKNHKKDGLYTYQYNYYFKPNIGYVGLEIYVDGVLFCTKTCTNYQIN